MPRMTVFGLLILIALCRGVPAHAANGLGSPPPTIDVGVTAPGAGGDGGGTSGQVDTGGGGVPQISPERQAYLDCVASGSTLCMSQPYRPGEPAPAAPAVDPAVLAQAALDSAAIALPEPHTSPDGVPQLTGLETWFWLDPDSWAPISARAELPGIWAEVTATPTEATWTPGDGGTPVTCAGPGREHPGTEGAETDCGHTYIDVGHHTLTVAVTYAVEWTSSTGAGATLDPIVVTAELPIDVEQRQAVTD